MDGRSGGRAVGTLLSRIDGEKRGAAVRRSVDFVLRYPVAFVGVLVLARAFFDGLGYQHPDDPFLLSEAGLRLLRGDFSAVYLDERVQVGPLGLVIYGIAGLLQEAGIGIIMALTVVAAVCFAFALWWCVRAVSPPDGFEKERAYGAVVVAVIAGLSWTASTSGHPTEGLVALLWVYAAYTAQRKQEIRSALALGLAVSIKLFAVLGLPLLLLLPGWRRRVQGGVVVGVIAAAAWGPFLLSGSFRMLEFTWQIRPQSPLALFLEAGSDFTWKLRVLQAGVVGLVGGGAAIVLRRYDGAFIALPVALLGLRFLTDPLDYHYYLLGPGSVALVGWAIYLNVRRSVWWLAAPAFYFVALVPFFYWGRSLLAAWILFLGLLMVLLPLFLVKPWGRGQAPASA